MADDSKFVDILTGLSFSNRKLRRSNSIGSWSSTSSTEIASFNQSILFKGIFKDSSYSKSNLTPKKSIQPKKISFSYECNFDYGLNILSYKREKLNKSNSDFQFESKRISSISKTSPMRITEENFLPKLHAETSRTQLFKKQKDIPILKSRLQARENKTHSPTKKETSKPFPKLNNVRPRSSQTSPFPKLKNSLKLASTSLVNTNKPPLARDKIFVSTIKDEEKERRLRQLKIVHHRFNEKKSNCLPKGPKPSLIEKLNSIRVF